MQRLVRILSFLSCLHFSICQWRYSDIDKSPNEHFTSIEKELLNDLSSDINGSKNFILLSDDLNFPCIKSSCERYDLTNLRKSLRYRGAILYKGENESYPELKEFKYKNAGSSKQDVFIFKISTFNEKEVDTIMNDIREYNAQSYIFILTANEESFTELKQYILSKKIYNLYIAKEPNHQGNFLIYEVCAFCNVGKTQIQYHNSWKKDGKFGKRFKFESSCKGPIIFCPD